MKCENDRLLSTHPMFSHPVFDQKRVQYLGATEFIDYLDLQGKGHMVMGKGDMGNPQIIMDPNPCFEPTTTGSRYTKGTQLCIMRIHLYHHILYTTNPRPDKPGVDSVSTNQRRRSKRVNASLICMSHVRLLFTPSHPCSRVAYGSHKTLEKESQNIRTAYRLCQRVCNHCMVSRL